MGVNKVGKAPSALPGRVFRSLGSVLIIGSWKNLLGSAGRRASSPGPNCMPEPRASLNGVAKHRKNRITEFLMIE